MSINPETSSKICPRALATIGGTITIMLYFTFAVMELWVAFAPNFSQPQKDILMWTGFWFCGTALFDHPSMETLRSFFKTEHRTALIYTLMTVLVILSFLGIFFARLEPFALFINAVVSVIVSFVASARIMKSDFISR